MHFKFSRMKGVGGSEPSIRLTTKTQPTRISLPTDICTT
jgi:hypothetical protein